ncbi:endonuclease MutS2 [Priestia taiwanensis]|uniref:Endonuclease MutS2 n=1 Tax=Priestia taiwanensis TaxID=1347902 RepID=A0A917EPR8_9BACI|nr:endonuclease MutS2 [Priestia taiwanensis]MBM7362606.1 MutS2 family protein [Priestia taiwanensis]GGE63619.1 endonuclease MutS2 [Priestia taiwanensis]
MNTMTFEKLQYNELKEIVKSYCVSGLGKQLLDDLDPSSNIKVVKHRLNETTEARKIIDAESHVPLVGISNINNLIDKLEKGIMLDPSDLLEISDFLRGCRKIKTYMLDKVFFAPTLSSYAHSMTEFLSVEEEINYSIKGNRVDSNASKELKRIRRHIESTEEKISERLTKFMKSGSNKEYIQEFFISKKDDKYTVPIKASYKHQVAGTIVEISSKGSTVFIEPAVISKLSGELCILKAEEAVEEYQILATLTGLVAEKLAEVRINMELIAQYDMVFAKAKFSKNVDGIEPKVNNHGFIQLIKCKHPLLKGNIVPLDFEVGKDYRSLVITGPNAGGKTVVLKTIGLLTLATMSGFHITAEEKTEIAIFDRIFVDIGDNQSIENALSTFSSHMKNMSEIMNMANHNTLLLFDEIGSGTEPNEGAALAIAILEELYHMGCITVATTHYGEIKRFSEMHSDFMNAAMRFDNETLEPLYQLVIGTSGDSNALWISRKMNIRDRVIERAKQYMDNKDYNLERVSDSKRKKPIVEEVKKETSYEYEVGDKVRLLDYEDVAIIYKKQNNYNNVTVFYKDEFIEVNEKRVSLEIRAAELYPEGYDVSTLFTSYKDRKMQHDMERGSKKALRKVQKEMKKKLN